MFSPKGDNFKNYSLSIYNFGGHAGGISRSPNDKSIIYFIGVIF